MRGPTWSVILLLINLIVTLQACDDVTEFQCADNNQCISKTDTCNTINDCDDGSDENNCACLEKLGMEDGTILDSSLIASSSKTGSSPSYARASNDKGNWCPKSDDSKPFFKVKFDTPRAISAIVFTLKQSVVDPLNYLSTWTLKAVLPGSDEEVTLYEGLNAFSNNSLYRSLFFPSLVTDTFIIAPTTWQNEPCLSFELYGCNIDNLCPTGCQNNGKCSGNDICACADGYFGTKCQFQKTTIPFSSYIFKSLESGSLVTSSETFTVRTSTTIRTSKIIEIQGRKVLSLPVADYFTAPKDGKFGCLSKLGSGGCKSFYLALGCELEELKDTVQLFTTGSDSTYIGAEATLKSDNLVVTFRTSELIWTLNVRKTNMFSSSIKYVLEFDWDISTGIRIYVNKKLIGQQRQATRTTQVLRTNTLATSGVEFFKSKSVNVKLFSLKSSSVNRISLIKTSLISLTPTEECDQEKEHKCANSDKCIDKSNVCDSVEDCDDGSDEQNCPTTTCDVKVYKKLVTKSASLSLDLLEVDDAQRVAKCTLPVISYVVDGILLDFLSKNQYGDQLSATNDLGANQNHNNNNKDDNNNNKKSSQDEFKEDVFNWADEPWTPCDDVEVPDWARMDDPTFDNFNSELIWAEDPWTQLPLVGLPSWMLLPGIDYPVEAKDPVVYTPVNDEDDAAFLASGIDIVNWSDEPYFQLPLDVPRWALLPGIDYPVRHGYNSPYWTYKLNQYNSSRREFGKKMFARQFPTLREERVLYNNNGQSKLCIPGNFQRRNHRF
ncbi:hypothetical protein LOTGIDRAFT_159188 [Lottia gigantea]|uniref:EGF-like domain-containing protein n=1 Tax=Lottia gigantea TaxID=225164 RepID=V4A3H0_LOTGI|nr:hypothetical protein LOTGIDRAFT_159188 [Lottia gigantea]ESO98383.1 hypothetical protein LOTGIDRAFT_159188 [Lottia gigantea]